MNVTQSNRPQVGQFGVVRTASWIGGLIRLMTRSQVNHAFVITRALPNGDFRILEAQTGGARYALLSKYRDYDVVFSDLDLTTDEKTRVCMFAARLYGTLYNFLDIAALFFLLLGWRANPILRRAQSINRLICSQLVDRVYHLAGIDLYEDGRPDGEVTPGDLLMLVAQGIMPKRAVTR